MTSLYPSIRAFFFVIFFFYPIPSFVLPFVDLSSSADCKYVRYDLRLIAPTGRLPGVFGSGSSRTNDSDEHVRSRSSSSQRFHGCF